MTAATCRRCGRPLRAALPAAAGIGGRCALLEALEAAVAPVVTVPHARAAVALVAAHLGEAGQDVHDHVLDGANPYDVASVLAAAAALVVARTDGGEQWLQDVGLAAAADGQVA